MVYFKYLEVYRQTLCVVNSFFAYAGSLEFCDSVAAHTLLLLDLTLLRHVLLDKVQISTKFPGLPVADPKLNPKKCLYAQWQKVLLIKWYTFSC